ncbi:hypothetical protein FJ444_17970 [Aestuariibacter sp. GS-14]|uniref:transporter substrate-binding domain-containing protein n=1 Tax=Aestuariibacter sp. GS-14 TaxID=2590670 RepID=UPI001125F773|nr:transporter substrate-binding domain-containing protein [Aestuariibacter sp. GS-14]TPV54746.1 hypothetical protein FJ444_17970 [Aestuariibacter sp. GS-14]
MRSLRSILFVLISLIPLHVFAETYVVASQNIPYFPHYEFGADADKGFAWALLEAYSEHTGVKFEYVAMPVLRLQVEMEKGNVDLVYPDHPTWTNPVNDNATKYYSAPLTDSLVGTFVKQERYGQGISRIRKLAIVLGFSPLYWQDRIDNGKTTLISVTDNKAALYLAQLDRADAVDMDYFVANYLMNTMDDIDRFILDPDLPVTTVEFCLSTLNNPELVADISKYINEHPKVISNLKKQYGLSNPLTVLNELKTGLAQ